MTQPWLALYPPGVGATLDVRHPTALDVWDAAVARDPAAPCVHFLGTTYDHANIDARSDALAADLVAGGLAAGDRVGILAQNDPLWPVALLATWKAGAIAVSLSPMLRRRELDFQLRDAGVAVLICLDELTSEAVPAAEDAGVGRVLVTTPDEPFPTGAAAPPRPALQPDDVAVLTYTSGTTGPPKGAMLTHGGISHNAQVPVDWYRLGPDDVVLGMAPLFHVTGLVLHLAMAWSAGASVVLGHRFDPAEILASVERHRPTFTIAAITAYTALLAHDGFADADLSSLRVAASGGAPVTLGVVQRFRDATGITISSVYGLTETTSPSHLTPPGATPPVDDESGALAVGVPVPGAVVTVVGVEDGEPVAPGEVGELVIAGPMVVPGYWGQPEQSAHAMPGGRLHTGDVGRMTEDGWFFVVDRKKDLIVASGYKVWPREVEEVLFEHPAVREAAVVGEPDEYRGETVVAWVVTSAPVEADELIAFCRERLAAYKYPRRVHVVDAIPKTSSGKVLRRELRGTTA